MEWQEDSILVGLFGKPRRCRGDGLRCWCWRRRRRVGRGVWGSRRRFLRSLRLGFLLSHLVEQGQVLPCQPRSLRRRRIVLGCRVPSPFRGSHQAGTQTRSGARWCLLRWRGRPRIGSSAVHDGDRVKLLLSVKLTASKQSPCCCLGLRGLRYCRKPFG